MTAEEYLAVPRLTQLGFAGPGGKGADFQARQLHILLKNNLAVLPLIYAERAQEFTEALKLMSDVTSACMDTHQTI